MNYKEKATIFWDWFITQEKIFRSRIDHKQYNVVNDALALQLQAVLPDVAFEISHQGIHYILELMPMGNAINRVMMLSLLLYQPKSLKHWQFYNYRTAKMGVMKYQDLSIDGKDILIVPVYDKKQNRLKLKVKADMLEDIPDEEKFRLFYVLLYEYIGEILCESLIEQVEFIRSLSYKFRYKKQEQVTLRELRKWISDHVGATNIKQVEQQGLIFESFSGKPNPLKKEPRYDIVKGYSALMELSHEYYEEIKPIRNYLKEKGIRPCYIYVKTTDQAIVQKILMNIRKELQMHGIMLGIGEALVGVYIDILCLDEQPFLNSIQQIYQEVPIQLYDF